MSEQTRARWLTPPIANSGFCHSIGFLLRSLKLNLNSDSVFRQGEYGFCCAETRVFFGAGLPDHVGGQRAAAAGAVPRPAAGPAVRGQRVPGGGPLDRAPADGD